MVYGVVRTVFNRLLSDSFRRNLTKAERLAYIKAFKCLQSKPARFQSLYPGSRSRYDDYQALHISMTEKIHFTVSQKP